jgi:hypothetical protein
MQSEKDVARAKEAEAAFHARLAAAQHEMETNPNPWERHRAADIVGRLTCHNVTVPRLPDDRLWFGSRWKWQYDRYMPEVDEYLGRCRRLWREQVVKATPKARRAKG